MPETTPSNETTLEAAGNKLSAAIDAAKKKTRNRMLLKQFGQGVLLGSILGVSAVIAAAMVAAALDAEASVD